MLWSWAREWLSEYSRLNSKSRVNEGWVCESVSELRQALQLGPSSVREGCVCEGESITNLTLQLGSVLGPRREVVYMRSEFNYFNYQQHTPRSIISMGATKGGCSFKIRSPILREFLAEFLGNNLTKIHTYICSNLTHKNSHISTTQMNTYISLLIQYTHTNINFKNEHVFESRWN